MFKKFLILPIIWLFWLTAFASAWSITITNIDNAYTPSEITFSDWHTLGISDLSNYSCEYTRCVLIVNNRHSDCTLSYSSDPSFQGDCAFEPWTYTITKLPKYSPFTSIVFSNDLIVSPIPETPDDSQWWLLPWSSDWSFWWWITNWVNAMLSWFWSVLPDILLFSFPILIIFLFWKHIYVFLKSVFTWRSRYSIREDMFIDDWYDKWSHSDKWKMILAQQKVFEKELSTPWMQDKYFYTENIDKTWHYFRRYDSWSDTSEVLWKDLKWHKV